MLQGFHAKPTETFIDERARKFIKHIYFSQSHKIHKK